MSPPWAHKKQIMLMEAALLLFSEYLLWGPQAETWPLLEIHIRGGKWALPLSHVLLGFGGAPAQLLPSSLSHGPHTCLTNSLSESLRMV